MRSLITKLLSLMLFTGIILMNVTHAQTVQVTFRVDMSEVGEISPDSVHIAGNFQGWNPGGTPMTQPPFGNVYSYTQEFAVGSELEFKYVNGNAWGQDESVPAGCAQNNNRYLTVPDQDITLNVVCFGSCTVCNPAQVEITFQVDMSNEAVSPNGVHLAGSFQDWDPSGTPMENIGDDIYKVTVSLGEGEYHEYKFVNGNEWGGDETVPPGCSNGWNRFINVPGVSTTLDAVCFGSCDPCGGAPVDVEITFFVDMSQQEISPAGVHIGGGFQGWDPATTPMVDEGGGIYSYTDIFPSGTYQEYKFINGITWDDAENLPPDCSNSNNRYFIVPQSDSIFDIVCYGLCGPCPEPAEVEITFQVDMTEQTVSADGVHLIGTFNNFDPTATPMSSQRSDVYEVTLTLTEADVHEYKFVNGNTLAGEETVPVECANGNGYRELTVPADTSTLDVVCFSSCDPCVPPPTVDVTFYVDMSNEEVSADGVHLAGSFNGFSTTQTPMTDPDLDNVYEATVTLVVDDHVTYKFINGNTFEGEEEVPPTCGEDDGFGGYNRYFDVTDPANVLDQVCFSSCEECVAPVEVNVTFRVDMQNETVSPNGVHVAGSFQGWNTGSDPMSILEDQVYTYTATFIAGENHEYKFLNGNTTADYEEISGDCTTLEGNRFITIPENDTIIGVVCYGSCEACPLPAEVEVTFQVDMNEQTVAPEGVHVAGTFNNFSTTETPLTDMDNGIWAVTLTLTEGDFIMYKFINGNSFEGFETVPPECSQEDGNRTLIVPGEELTLDPVCFGSCDPCVPPPTANITFQVDMSNEVVSQDGVHLAGSFNEFSTTETPLTDAGGGIYSVTLAIETGEHITFKYLNGISFDFAENVPAECGEDDGFGGFNRYLDVPENDSTLALHCFSSCEACTQPVDVTFQVDMSNEEVSPDGVHIAGSFNDFDPTATMLTDQGSGVYAVTVTLFEGDHITYKYTNGPSFDFVETVPAECGEDDGFGGFNRYVDVPEVDYEIPLHCFSSCDVCADLTHEITLFEGWNSLSSYLMPTSNDINDVMDPIANELIILQTMTEVLFPEGGLNTINTWDSQSAYKIKVSADVVLTITGTPEQNKTLQLDAGWNLMPVVSEAPVDVESLFADVIDQVIVVKGIAETGILWPDYDINTLGTVIPGKAYLIKVSEAIDVTFP